MEPRRQELLRMLNHPPGGTIQLVRMRQDLLRMMRSEPDLAPLDSDFCHLLTSWFNRGFLVMRRIDWNSPAAILEKDRRLRGRTSNQGLERSSTPSRAVRPPLLRLLPSRDRR
ncbi:malonyl-CoA decarboxylase [Leisingera thetidis]|uniref:malonyl-CoA decarboxylase n=1 Tax=Leisingera thetidis TaxID=2930199 RepID=UPI0021F71F68|nr:malonyl-CoA decarboxylase [Leisingera thetidis]